MKILVDAAGTPSCSKSKKMYQETSFEGADEENAGK